MKKAAKILVTMFIALAVVGSVTGCGNASYQASRIVNKTIDADNVLYNYDYFFNINEGLKALDKNIADCDKELKSYDDMYAGKPRSDWASADVDRYNFVTDTKRGYVQMYNKNASDYNANSQKLNTKIFKDWSLPDRITLK